MNNILILTFWSYKEGLIQTYTLPYLKQISRVTTEQSCKIYLVTLEKETYKLSDKEKQQAELLLKNDRIELVTFTYHRFGILSLLKWVYILFYLLWFIVFKRVKFIHAFCTPAAAPASILATLTRRKLVVDSYEPHAEASVENGDWKRDSLAFKILFALEKYLSHKANFIISATESMYGYAKNKYGIDEFENFYVKPACVDLDLFSWANVKQTELVKDFSYVGKIVCVYAGKFGGIYLDQEVFDFFKVAQEYWGDRFRVLLLTNQSIAQLQEWADQSGFDMNALQTKFVLHKDIPDYIGLGDFGITPVKPIPTKRYCTPIKNGEYWALGLPIVSTANISDDSDIIEDRNVGAIIRSFGSKAYLEAIEKIDTMLKSEDKKSLFDRIRAIAYEYRSFDISMDIYSKIYATSEKL
ncbi:MAG: hypothetical protein V3V00_04235 [Saprospiraceae bacterium]